MRGSVVILLAVIFAAPAEAQSVMIAPVVASPDHDVLSSRVGAVAAADVPMWTRVSLRVAVDHSRGSQTRFGSMCVGLIDPSQPPCVSESIEDRSTAATFSAGAAIDVLNRQHMSIALVPEWLLGRRHVTTTGQSTRQQFRTARHPMGVAMGVEGALRPAAWRGVSFVAGVRRAWFAASLVAIEDGWDPMRGAFTETSVHAGLRLGR